MNHLFDICLLFDVIEYFLFVMVFAIWQIL